MNSLPFSVAMSVYKNDVPEHFDRALESITGQQTIIPNEIVLIVDGPVPDGIDLVIEKYKKLYPIFKVIRLENNSGLGNALRLAIKNCSYELVARMDSDDVAMPQRFEEQIRYYQLNPMTDLLGGNISEFIDDEHQIVAERIVPQFDNDIKEFMKARCAFNHMTVMYKKSSVLKAGNYVDWFWNEDYYLWIRMMESGCIFANTGTVLVNVRTGKDMYSRRGGKKYYDSEKALQDYMLERKIIGKKDYILNVCKRFIVQVLLPNYIRGWAYRNLARKKKS